MSAVASLPSRQPVGKLRSSCERHSTDRTDCRSEPSRSAKTANERGFRAGIDLLNRTPRAVGTFNAAVRNEDPMKAFLRRQFENAHGVATTPNTGFGAAAYPFASFDRVYVINLPTRRDRARDMRSQFQKIGSTRTCRPSSGSRRVGPTTPVVSRQSVRAVASSATSPSSRTPRRRASNAS
jgi:hypothetical protein